MNRLRNEAGLDPISERGIEMLRHTPATPSSPDRKRRVWVSLQRTAVRNARRRAGSLAGLVLGLAGVAVATTAAAALGGRWISAARARAARAVVPPAARGTAPRKLADRQAPARAEAPPAVEGARSAPARRPGRAASGARGEVLAALVALRRDRDPARAARLLDGYLATERQGPLREEALALDIEAADARPDPARARQLARAYAAAYPAGRFAAFAGRHLEGGPGEPASPPR